MTEQTDPSKDAAPGGASASPVTVVPPGPPPVERFDPIFRIWIGLLSFAAAGWLVIHFGFGSFDFNLPFFVVPTGLTIILLWCMLVNLIRRKGLLWKLRPALITGGVLSWAMLQMSGQLLYQERWVIPYLKAFASTDFAEFDPDNTGFVTAKQLEAVKSKNSRIKANLRDLNDLSGAVAQSEGDEMAKGLAGAGLTALENQDRAALRSDEQIGRVSTVAFYACSVGTRVNANAPNGCQVSRDDLIHFEDKLKAKYPIWQKFFDQVHQLWQKLFGLVHAQ